MTKPDTKRRTFCLVGMMSAMTGCLVGPKSVASSPEKFVDQRFRGVHGIRSRIDAAILVYGVTIVDEDGDYVARAGRLSPKHVQNSLYPDASSLPKTIHVSWHVHPVTSSNDKWIGGKTVGDFTVSVAGRIPDNVLDAVRRGDGGLRVKIRLAPGRVMVGWDVERVISFTEAIQEKLPDSGVFHSMAGGDFCEAKIVNGEVVRPGWYIENETGRKIETNF